MINNDPWKKRLIDEYEQLKNRYDRLCARVALMDVDWETEGTSHFMPCESDRAKEARCKREVERTLLHRQQMIMNDYLRTLEARIKLEGMLLPCEMEDAGIKHVKADDPSDLF